jgi:hypothetical protein
MVLSEQVLKTRSFGMAETSRKKPFAEGRNTSALNDSSDAQTAGLARIESTCELRSTISMLPGPREKCAYSERYTSSPNESALMAVAQFSCVGKSLEAVRMKSSRPDQLGSW